MGMRYLKEYWAILRVIQENEYSIAFFKRHRLLGQIDFCEYRIMINLENPHEVLATFIHELLHAAYPKDSERAIAAKERAVMKFITVRQGNNLIRKLFGMRRK